MIGGAPDSPCGGEKPGLIPVGSVPVKSRAKDWPPYLDVIMDTLERVESKLDFILRQSSRKESVGLAPKAYSALAQAGMDPRELQTHRVVTSWDDWMAEQTSGKIHCQKCGAFVIQRGEKVICQQCELKEDGDEQK